MAPKKNTSPQTVYQLKITLKNIRPPIWRRIQVDSSTTLEQLHSIVQVVMGWEDYHLYSFSIAGRHYSPSEVEGGTEGRSEESVRIDRVIGGEKFKFHYTYDFGDDWEHEILVEKKLPADPDTHYPLCVTGKRACPPEDCGGPWGYLELLEILADPANPEYEERIEWVGDDFDPNAFDLAGVNRQLQEL